MKASAYVNKTNYATESWLISPVIDMSSAVNPVLSFMTVACYGSNENLTLWAREKGGDWAQLSFSNYGTGNDWNFVSNTVDLSAYAGKTLQFAYKYVSTGSGASTWEIKNVEVKEQGAAATLSSIAWTGYTTTYTVGDVFKADGTVTATYSDGSTKDVTSEASFSTPDMSTAGKKTVTVTYEGKITTGEITVDAAGTKVVTLGTDWNALFGKSYNGTISSLKANALSLSGTKDNVTIAVSNGTSTNGYVKTGDFRAYNGYTITLSVPDGKKITDISTTKGGKTFTSGISANTGKGSISNNAYTWSGSSQTVVLSISGTVSFATIVVTYE